TTELRGRVTLTIFTLTAVSLFTCSAIYHRVPWGPSAKAIWRRIDHANIPFLIAGTYTPFAIYLLDKSQAVILLSLVWGGALLSGVFRVFWLSAPRWLYVPIYLALGWAALIYLPDFYRNGGLAVLLLVAFGGILYSLGAIIYAVKWPNFSINWFGFHELFHAMTAAAFISHFIAAILVIVG
ncbi:MAG: PAQR family membrane homeostasis protein TrhA, partial [Candidatus Nanopelagicaceae bacterium]